MNKPYAAACDENKDAILEVIKPLFIEKQLILEIGSGTGQHAVYFAEHMPHLIWQTSDVKPRHQGISQWLADAKLDNLKPPLELDVRKTHWQQCQPDAIFSANTVHMMSLDAVGAFFHGVGQCLQTGGAFVLYGAFNYEGQYTSASNLEFDQWLQSLNPAFGVRDFELLNQLANASSLQLENDFEMPANNRILHWVKC